MAPAATRQKANSLDVDVLDMVLNDIEVMNKDFHINQPPGQPVPSPIDDPLLPLPLAQPTGNEDLQDRLSDDFLFSLTENDWEIGGGTDSPEGGTFWSK